jgi:hypothetical protein
MGGKTFLRCKMMNVMDCFLVGQPGFSDNDLIISLWESIFWGGYPESKTLRCRCNNKITASLGRVGMSRLPSSSPTSRSCGFN